MGADIVIAWNGGDGRFLERTILKGDGKAEIYSLCAGDPDGDGDLDLYATRYVAGGINGGVPTPYHDANNGASNHYWMQEQARLFRDATEEVGLAAHNSRFSLAAVFEDLDDDGDADLYVTNDFGQNNLFRNEGGKFEDVAGQTGTRDMAAGMGITCADVNGDGKLDLYVSNMFTDAGIRVTAQPAFLSNRGVGAADDYRGHTRGNTLLMGRGNGMFEDSTSASHTGPGGWAWGALFGDWDNDGWADLYVPNGFITNREPVDLDSFFWRRVVNATPEAFPPNQAYIRAWQTIQTLSLLRGFSWNGRERNSIYWNLGHGVFSDVSGASGVDYADDGRSVVALDWDGDGFLDLALRNRTGPRLRLLLNNASIVGNHSLTVILRGGTSGRTTVGTRVRVTAGGKTLERRRRAGEGYLGSSSPRLRFGLGTSAVAERVTVIWPGGVRETHEDLATDRTWTLTPGQAALPGAPLARRTPAGTGSAPGPGFASASAAAVQARVVLAERLPLGNLPRLPLAGQPGTWEDLARLGGGSPVLMVAFAAGDDPSDALLASLSSRKERILDLGLIVAPLVLDGPRLRGKALTRLQELGLSEHAFAVDRRLLQLLELITVEILGAYDALPLPLCWLLDPAAQLTVIYVSPTVTTEVEELLSDVTRVRYLDGSSQDTSALTGGRWVTAPRRRTLGLAAILERLGERDLAQVYERFDGR
jgi:hypothetical protein